MVLFLNLPTEIHHEIAGYLLPRFELSLQPDHRLDSLLDFASASAQWRALILASIDRRLKVIERQKQVMPGRRNGDKRKRMGLNRLMDRMRCEKGWVEDGSMNGGAAKYRDNAVWNDPWRCWLGFMNGRIKRSL